jgi:uncharacterized protein (TIGR02246 family)
LLLTSPPPVSATSAETGAQADALMNNARAFVNTFETGDAKAIAAFWAEDGDYVDVNGRQLQGRSAIENAFKGFFIDKKGLKLRIDVNSVHFLTPEMTIEDRTTSVIPPDDTPPSQVRYTNVHVKKDGQWLVQSVREAPYTPPGNHEHLVPATHRPRARDRSRDSRPVFAVSKTSHFDRRQRRWVKESVRSAGRSNYDPQEDRSTSHSYSRSDVARRVRGHVDLRCMIPALV